MKATAEGERPIVVVVEDNADLAEVYTDWLADGHRVRTCHTGEGAKDAIDSDVDVVLLDRKLPGTSGDEVLDWIKAQGFEARVAMITAVSPDFDVIEMGFDTYVVKPVSRREIRDTVQMLLTRTIYDQRVQRYLELQSIKRVLEDEKHVDDLEGSQRYRRLSNELAEIRAELDYLLRNLDDEYFTAEMEALVGPTGVRRELGRNG